MRARTINDGRHIERDTSASKSPLPVATQAGGHSSATLPAPANVADTSLSVAGPASAIADNLFVAVLGRSGPIKVHSTGPGASSAA